MSCSGEVVGTAAEINREKASQRLERASTEISRQAASRLTFQRLHLNMVEPVKLANCVDHGGKVRRDVRRVEAAAFDMFGPAED